MRRNYGVGPKTCLVANVHEGWYPKCIYLWRDRLVAVPLHLPILKYKEERPMSRNFPCTGTRIVLAVSLASAAILSVNAATVNGRIKGTVSDPASSRVAGAQVTATNTATGVKAIVTAQSDGVFTFAQLPVGTYSIRIDMPGFKSYSSTGIVVNIDTEYTLDVHLAIGQTTEVVQVAAEPVQINTTDMQLNNIVTSAQMVELPLIGRGFTGLELILPGVQASSDRFGSYSANGAQTQQSSYLINGADTNDIALNTITFQPNLDAIDQFNLVTGPLNAEYDRNSGGIVSATIKKGTNHFHGDAFEFYRDTFLNTGNYFSYSTTTNKKIVTAYHQNIFGGTLGGPILKDKLFFFGAFQGTRQRVPGTGGSTNVFSSAQRNGDFSDDIAGNALGYQFSSTNVIPGTLTGITGCPAGTTWASCVANNGGKFNSANFNPIATKLLSQYVPNANSGANTYVFQSVNTSSINQYIGQFDFSLDPTNTFNFVYLQQKAPTTSVIPFTGASLPGFGEIDNSTVRQFTFDYIRQLSSTLVNDFAAHYTRFNYLAVSPQNVVNPSSLGFSITPQNAAAASVPSINTGYFTLGFSTNGPQPRVDQVYQLDDVVSKSLGRHQLKFGYDGRKFLVSNPFYANNSGSYGYSPTGSFSSGDPGLDFLLGNPSSYAQGSGATIQAYAFLNYVYGQDTWRATDALTLSYGLGYQIDTPLHNQQYGGEGIACFIPGQQSKVFTTAPIGLNYPGDPGCSNSAQANTRYSGLGPRIGFAYAPSLGFLSGGSERKFAVRGGFGIYYNRTEEETSLNNLETAPFGIGSQGAVDYGGSAPAFANPYQDIDTGQAFANKFPYTFPTRGQTIDYSIFEPLLLNTYNHNFRSPYAENFQLSVERELPSHMITRLSYVASLGRHNQTAIEGNPETQAGHDACLASADCASRVRTTNRTYQSYDYPSHTQYGIIDPNTGSPAYPTIGTVTSTGSSNYNSFQASIDKGETHGLQFQLSYTYSHALDDASSYENAGYGGTTRGYNQFVPALNYGNSAFDVRHRLVFAPIYILPFRQSGSALSFRNIAAAGWQVSGILTEATGFPFDLSYGGGSANSLWCSPGFSFYACPDEPNQTGSLARTNPRTKLASGSTSWFDSQASGISVAPIGTFGNVSRNKFHGPGINNTNLIVAKNFDLGHEGSYRLQLRMESDNVFNHTQFSNPASTFGATAAGAVSYSTSGQINSAAAARQTQLAAKLYF